MGHEIRYKTFDIKVDKKEITNRVNDICERDGEYHTGLYSPIKFKDSVIFDNVDKATDYINSIDNGWYDAIAVQYKEPKSNTNTKEYDNAQKKANELYTIFRAKANNVHYKDVKSAFVGCKNCGSKLSTKYISRNICPLCNEDLRPQSTLDDINNAKKRYEDAQKKANEIKQKQTDKNYNVKWLVKFEYHV